MPVIAGRLAVWAPEGAASAITRARSAARFMNRNSSGFDGCGQRCPSRVQPCQGEALLSPLSSREPVTFSIFSCFFDRPDVFQSAQKGVILSEAPRRSVAYQRFYGAKSKDPGNAYPQCCSELFNQQSPHRADSATVFPLAENQELASNLLCPAATSTFSASIQAQLRCRKAPSSMRKRESPGSFDSAL
jgi:hypothetical protein